MLRSNYRGGREARQKTILTIRVRDDGSVNQGVVAEVTKGFCRYLEDRSSEVSWQLRCAVEGKVRGKERLPGFRPEELRGQSCHLLR